MNPTPCVQFEDTSVAFSYKSNIELKNANFIFTLLDMPFVSTILTHLLKWSLFLHLPVKGIVQKTIFSHFCGGETMAACERVAKHLFQYNVQSVPDYSVEGEKTEQGFDKTTEELLRVLKACKENKALPFCVFKVTGIADSELLEKIQNKITLTSREQEAFDKVKKRMNTICNTAYKYQVPVMIDAEDSWIQDPIDDIVYEMMHKYNREKTIVFNTFQMYRKDMSEHLHRACHEADTHGYFLGVKIVRGAYMEKERKRAAKMNYPSPIHINKQFVDEEFNKGLAFCMNNIQRIVLICGSHNIESSEYLTLLMTQCAMQCHDNRVWFIHLYGMSDTISFNLASKGYNVAKYLPYGPVGSVVPYLLRRAEENTSLKGQTNRELTFIRKELKRRKKLHSFS